MAISLAQASSLDLSADWNFTGTLTGMGTAGAMTLIKTLTASSSNSLSFVHGTDGVVLDSTYKSYRFVYNSLHPSTNTGGIFVNFSTDSGSNWNVIKTTADFIAQHSENNATTELRYGNYDLAQSTSDQALCKNVYTGNDETVSGEMYLYNPSSTTYVKHFTSVSNSVFASARSWQHFVGGYCNTTSAINGVIFRFDSGNIDDGTISLYGIS